MSNVVLISGSPSVTSRTDMVLRHVKALLENQGIATKYISVLDIPQRVLFYAQFESPEIKRISTIIERADGIIIGSPVYKAAYTGILKSFLDLLPEGAFKNTPVFPLMVGGSKSHLLAIDFSLKPLISTLKGKATQGVYLLDSDIDKNNSQNPLKGIDDLQRLQNQLSDFIESIQHQKQFSA